MQDQVRIVHRDGFVYVEFYSSVEDELCELFEMPKVMCSHCQGLDDGVYRQQLAKIMAERAYRERRKELGYKGSLSKNPGKVESDWRSQSQKNKETRDRRHFIAEGLYPVYQAGHRTARGCDMCHKRIALGEYWHRASFGSTHVNCHNPKLIGLEVPDYA